MDQIPFYIQQQQQRRLEGIRVYRALRRQMQGSDEELEVENVTFPQLRQGLGVYLAGPISPIVALFVSNSLENFGRNAQDIVNYKRVYTLMVERGYTTVEQLQDVLNELGL